MNQKSPLLFLAIALFYGIAFFSGNEGHAQVRPTRSDSLVVTPKDTAAVKKRGDIETTINYKAKDSIRYDAVSQIMYLYGDAHIDYGEVALDAAFIQINWKTSIIDAEGMKDSAGVLQNKPLFKNGAETYQAERMSYNYKTKKGRVIGAVTTQGEGFIHAETIKRDSAGSIYGRHARYTTCDLEHPHFYIKATKMKVIPNDRVIAGPFHLVFADVPTPIGLPFGFFPSPRKRGSGVIIPTFGESNQQGFYLREGGFYWAMNEYMDLRLTGDIYSLGGYGARVQSTYTKRYKFSGSFSLSHTFIKASENIGAGATTDNVYNYRSDSRDIWISWSHQPVTRPGQGQFSASVNAGSQFYNQRNSTSPQNALSPAFNSTVSYRKSSPNSPINYGVTISQSQTTRTQANAQGEQVPVQQMSFTLPDFSFGVASQSPIEWFGGTLTGRWIEGIRIGYNLNARQYVTNNISAGSGLGFPFSNRMGRDTVVAINGSNLSQIFRNARTSINHDIPITLGTVSLFKYFKLTPGVSYSESWFTKKFTYRNVPGSNLLAVDTLKGLQRTYQYQGGVSLATNLYGTAQIKGKKIEAIRHTLTPNLSYSFRPDFGNPEFGFYQRVQRDSLGNTQLLSRFQGLEGNVPGPGLSSALSFSVNNNVEMKVKTDSAGVFKKVSLIDAFNLAGSYNMAADSFKLSNISVNLSTKLFNNVGVTLSGSFDPYQYENGRPVDRYLIEGGGFRLARLMNLNFNTGFEFNQQARKQQAASGAAPPTNLPALQRTVTAADYVEFNIPWTLSVDLTSNFTRDALTDKLMNNATSAGINGSVTLTDKWAVNYTTSYDLKNKILSYTNIGIVRDLHCWQMSIDWVPFGVLQRYSININAKSALLQDLRLRRSSSASGRPY
ncbi:putative LPS assembly protein LptD [Rufibacter glacialis]|uniref:LPS-assembly protein LptD n=1 Tax=Rufibacter glacialis TaxID=1259555 RepID=A0A5M8QT94_9BACT|nr:putative LPS assembly protein LptD [Rufibacter glacialis]KAA6437422.1 LPS-assembly protein LptD [Rufibacter glacialis]GGK59393.1 organic solvent tolerance protein OstA [Rufibacter glacialis]